MNQFDRNQKEFPSYAHRSIWSNGLLLVPPDISLENMESEHKEACIDLYRYKTDMFADMYQNPEQYAIDTESIQNAMNGRPWHKAHLSARWNKKKDVLSKLDEVERTNLPNIVCGQLLAYLTCNGNEYSMSEADFSKFFVTQSLKKCSYNIGESEFLAILSRCGLSTTHKNDRFYFSNHKYPLMFAAIERWQKLLEPYRKGSEKYKYDSAFLHLDYRFFSPDHKLTFENSKWYMNDEVIAYLDNINDILSRQGKGFSKLDKTLRIAIGSRLKGNGFMEFEHFRTYPTFRAKLFHSDSAEYRSFEERISQLPNADEVKDFCLKWIRRCNRCPCRPKLPASVFGNPRVILGRPMRLCGPYLMIETTDFSEKSLNIMKIVMNMSDTPAL